MYYLKYLFFLLFPVLPSTGISSAQESSLPRFASLRSGEINVRTGPGTRHPIEWHYVKRSLPVEIISEFNTWRKIRDPHGEGGWIHSRMLSMNRTFYIPVSAVLLYHENSITSHPIAQLEEGVIGQIIKCPSDAMGFCNISISGYEGWIRRSDIWGVYAHENF